MDGLKRKSPIIVCPNVNGNDVVTGDKAQQASPFDHSLILANYYHADKTLVASAIDGALEAKKSWLRTSLHDRAAIFYRAASLLQNEYREEMMAATMLGQGKNPYQADIDCVAESIDFLKAFPSLADGLYNSQPPFNAPGVWNRSEQRPIDGFVYAISPFNFTALAVNLVLAPIIVGNVVIWKPSPGAILSSWLFNNIMIKAGLPKGVLQFLPGDAEEVTDAVFESRDFGGLHFTGSTTVFRSLLARIGAKQDFWRAYPRVVGETGGKNFHLLHPTANVRNAALKTLRAAFEYQGQKCSACSRVYVPASLADEFISVLTSETSKLTMGGALTDFIGPVIHRAAFTRIRSAIEAACADPAVTILEGGECDHSTGFFIRPTILRTTDPKGTFMRDEIFGPVLTLYVYDDAAYGPEIFKLVDETAEYALSGAFFASDRAAIVEATEELRFAAGNFYIK